MEHGGLKTHPLRVIDFSHCTKECPGHFPRPRHPDTRYMKALEHTVRDNREFETALARKMGLPVKILLPMSVRVSGPTEIYMLRSSIRLVMASLPRRVSGDHARRFHDRIVNALVKLVKAVGVPVKGGYDGTCKGTFGMSFAAGADVAEEDVRVLSLRVRS